VAQGPRWLPEEIEFALGNLSTMTIEEIAAALGRPPHGVQQWLSSHGIRKPRVQRKPRRSSEMGHIRNWRNRLYTRLGDEAGPGQAASLARAAGVTAHAVYAGLYRRGVRLTDDGLLSIRAVARTYGVHARRIRALIAAGYLPAMRSGRWVRLAPDDVERITILLRHPARRRSTR
jgi:excisionase family DNA binding protein